MILVLTLGPFKSSNQITVSFYTEDKKFDIFPQINKIFCLNSGKSQEANKEDKVLPFEIWILSWLWKKQKRQNAWPSSFPVQGIEKKTCSRKEILFTLAWFELSMVERKAPTRGLVGRSPPVSYWTRIYLPCKFQFFLNYLEIAYLL